MQTHEQVQITQPKKMILISIYLLLLVFLLLYFDLTFFRLTFYDLFHVIHDFTTSFSKISDSQPSTVFRSRVNSSIPPMS